MSELKPCPFCGGEAGIGHDPRTNLHWAACMNPKCPVVWNTLVTTAGRAAEIWNKRPLEDDLLAACEAANDSEWLPPDVREIIEAAIAKVRGEKHDTHTSMYEALVECDKFFRNFQMPAAYLPVHNRVMKVLAEVERRPNDGRPGGEHASN